MIIGLILSENVIILNLYKPSNKVSKYVKQKLTEILKEIDNHQHDGDHKLLPVHDRANRQKYQKILGHEASPNKI